MNNQPAFIVGHHHPREPTVILMFPPARTASLETTWKLNPNANTLWETCGSLQWESTRGRTPAFAVAAELSPGRASPALMLQRTGALLCGNGRCRLALPEAGLQRSTEREPNPLCRLCFGMHIVSHLLWIFNRASVGYYIHICSYFVSGHSTDVWNGAIFYRQQGRLELRKNKYTQRFGL